MLSSKAGQLIIPECRGSLLLKLSLCRLWRSRPRSLEEASWLGTNWGLVGRHQLGQKTSDYKHVWNDSTVMGKMHENVDYSRKGLDIPGGNQLGHRASLASALLSFSGMAFWQLKSFHQALVGLHWRCWLRKRAMPGDDELWSKDTVVLQWLQELLWTLVL